MNDRVWLRMIVFVQFIILFKGGDVYLVLFLFKFCVIIVVYGVNDFVGCYEWIE